MADTEDEYELTGPDADGRGIYLDDGFLVNAGSIARREVTPSGKSVSTVHQRLVDEGTLEEHQGRFRFTPDYKFETPSGAAAAVLGRTANGWISWKRPDGRTLSEVTRIAREKRGPILTKPQRSKILSTLEKLANEAKLPTKQQLDAAYSLFRERFDPSVLAKLEGEALLTFMQDHGNHDSLVY